MAASVPITVPQSAKLPCMGVAHIGQHGKATGVAKQAGFIYPDNPNRIPEVLHWRARCSSVTTGIVRAAGPRILNEYLHRELVALLCTMNSRAKFPKS